MLILWIRPIHLFVTAKKSGWVRCYYHVQSGFCLKIWWTINPWAFVPFVCLTCMLLPSYSPPPATTLPYLPRLLSVLVWGLAVVLCLGSLAVPAAVWRCQHGQQPRGIRRWLYVERLTVGTHQGHCIMQAGASLLQAKKYFLLIVWQLGPTPLSM